MTWYRIELSDLPGTRAIEADSLEQAQTRAGAFAARLGRHLVSVEIAACRSCLCPISRVEGRPGPIGDYCDAHVPANVARWRENRRAKRGEGHDRQPHIPLPIGFYSEDGARAEAVLRELEARLDRVARAGVTFSPIEADPSTPDYVRERAKRRWDIAAGAVRRRERSAA